MTAHAPDFERQSEKLEKRLPGWVSRAMHWTRTSSIWLRLPIALAFIAGGVFAFLPVFGLWMIPLGLVLMAQDVPFLRPPLARLFRWINNKL